MRKAKERQHVAPFPSTPFIRIREGDDEEKEAERKKEGEGEEKGEKEKGKGGKIISHFEASSGCLPSFLLELNQYLSIAILKSV
jgi:hypothetical protein